MPNDPFGMAQAALGATAVAELAGTFQTPAQVLLRGWGGGAAASWQDERAPRGERERDESGLLRPSLSDAYFAPLSVAPRREDDNEARTQEAENRLHPAQTDPEKPAEPERLVLAPELMRDPVDDDFLRRLDEALADPLPSEAGAGAGAGVAGPDEPQDDETGVPDDGASGMIPSTDGEASGPAGAGGAAVGSGEEIDPFLPALTATSPSQIAPARTDNFVLPSVPLAPLGQATSPAVPLPAVDALTSRATVAPAAGASSASSSRPGQSPSPPSLVPDFARLPLAFEPNLGQASPGTAFVARGAGYGIALAPDGITLALSPTPTPGAASPATPDLVQIHFAGAGSDATLRGVDELQARSNYFRAGDHPLTLTDVPTYATVSQELAPGVSVVYHGNGPNLQFDFHLAGTDVSAVAISYRGISGATVDDQGQLVLHTLGGRDLVQQAPVLYQTAPDGTRQVVAGGYAVRPDGSVGFHIDAAYDHTRELVLDPTLSLSSYLGGSSTDNGNAIAVDPSGNIYLVGGTSSSNFLTVNAYDSTLATGMGDAFLTKVSPAGTVLYSTYLGGVNMAGNDTGLAVAVDAAGSAYLTGQASSSDFPTTTGAYQTTLSGGTDTFVTKFSAAGNALVFSTLLGGSSASETGRAIGVAADGSVFVAGQTDSTNFPTLSAAQSTNGGGSDGFVTRLKADGSGLLFSTYAGGSGTDDLRGLAVDAQNRVVVMGTTASSGLGTTGAYDTSLGGTQDLFVRRYTNSGSLDWSSYVGGSSTEGGNAVALDSTGKVYLAGTTASSGLATGGAYQSTLSGGQDAFVAQLSADGTSLGWLSYFGGGGSEEGDGLAVDANQNVYVAGLTTTQTGFPLSNAVQSSYGGGTKDAYVAALNAGGASLAWSTYLGGIGDDNAAGLALDLDNNVYVVGSTSSGNFPTASPFQASNGGGTDAFLAKIAQPPPPPVFTSISDDLGSSGTDQITTGQNQSLSGTSVAGATVTLYRAGVGQLGTTTASSPSGLWTYTYSNTLSDGTYAFTGTATANGKTSAETGPFLVNVDLTAPSVTLNADATTYTKAPVVRVTATDQNLAATTTVTLDVDTNNDGNFTGGDLNYTTGTLTNGVALIAIAPVLAIGTVKVRARVTDKAGKEGTSNTQTVVVQSSGSGYTATDLTQQVDPFTGDALLQRGNLTVAQPLDFDLSPGTAVGGSPALVYSSERVSVKPILAASVQTDNGVSLPGSVTATLTWNGGTPQTGQTLNTTGLAAGDLIEMAQQVASAVGTTGRYPYSLQLSLSGTGVSRTISGAAFVIAEDSSPYGAGWTLAGVDKLVAVAATLTYSAGMLREYGAGGYGFYTDNGAGGYTSPAGHNGTLTKATGGGLTTYTYTRPDGSTQTFDNAGLQVKATSADGFAAITYTYTSGNLTGIATPDGALTTLTLSSGKVTAIQTGARTVTLTIDPVTSNLTTIGNADGGLHTLAYDGSHHLTDDNLSVLRGTYAYTSGALTGFTSGDASTDSSAGRSTVSPAVLFGLSSLAAGPVLTSVTDPLGRVTREQLDTSGRPTLVLAPDGGATQLSRDSNGWVTKQTDPLNRVTTLVLDSAGYPTQVTTPDGNSQSYSYQASYHALTQYTDQRGNLYTYTYDSNNGHLLTAKDPLNQVTSFTYNTTSGLPETVKDALGRVSTALYDSARRLQTTINALGDRGTLTYDSNGNVATRVDELSRTTTFVNDALGRVTQQTDALGGIWTTTYNGAGLVTSQKDALGRTTNTTYNSRGEVTKLVRAAGTSVEQSELASYDTAGQQTSSRDVNGNWSYQAFDAVGRPTVSTDALGGKQQVVYDLAGERTRMLDQLGRPTDYSFDSLGRVKTTTDALGNVTTAVYDAAGNVTEVDDARGYKTTVAYDALNRPVAMTRAAGTSDAATSTTVYDAVGNVFQTIDPLGHITENTYDALNRRTQVTEAKSTGDQRSMTIAYDKVGNATSMTDWRGYRTDTTFDKLNRPTVVTEAVGTSVQRVTTTVYDAVGNGTSRVDALGHTLSVVYDALNREVSRTEAVGTAVARTVTTLYDAAGNQTGAVDPLGVARQAAQDALGRNTVNIDALGNVARTYYDGAAGLRASVDANGNRTDYFTDGLGRTQRIVDALGNTVTLLYDAVGNQTGAIDARGNRSTVVYDGLGRVIAQTDALNHAVTTVYDKASNIVQQIDASGKTFTYTYDNLNRPITAQDPGAGIATTVYDAASNVVNTLDPLGHKGTMVYDELGRKTKDIDALGGTTTYLYDALNNQTGLLDPVGNRTTFVLDALNRVTQETDPLGHSLTMAYDAADRLTSRTDRLGRRIDNSYDLDGRIVTQTWRDAGGGVVNTLTFVYDGVGNQTVAQDSHGAYTLSYDALSRASTMKGLYGVTLTFTYDAVGNRTKVQDSFGGVLTSVYDNANRLTSQQFGGVSQTPLRFDLGYTERNQVATLTRYSDLAGTTKVGESDYTYDSVGRLQNLQHKNGSGTVLENYTYTYDLASRVTTEKLNGGAPTTYVYDNTDQLTNDGTKAYSYDANGNRTMAGYTTGTGNRLSNDGVYTYTYDNEGNLTKKSKGASAETWTYTYDNRNQMVGVTERSTDGGGTLLFQGTYLYDVYKNRVQADEYVNGGGTTTTKSIYGEPGTVFADLTSGNAMQTRYLRLNDAQYAAVVARIDGNGVAWLLLDRLGSTRNVVNGSGTLIGTVVYDGFGSITSESSPTNTGNVTFTGLTFLRNAGLLGAHLRIYDPLTGNWSQQDPIRWQAGDSKLDRYVGNNPTNGTDPQGEMVQFVMWAGRRFWFFFPFAGFAFAAVPVAPLEKARLPWFLELPLFFGAFRIPKRLAWMNAPLTESIWTQLFRAIHKSAFWKKILPARVFAIKPPWWPARRLPVPIGFNPLAGMWVGRFFVGANILYGGWLAYNLLHAIFSDDPNRPPLHAVLGEMGDFFGVPHIEVNGDNVQVLQQMAQQPIGLGINSGPLLLGLQNLQGGEIGNLVGGGALNGALNAGLGVAAGINKKNVGQ